jgi:DNA-binding response OmpR family regulator
MANERKPLILVVEDDEEMANFNARMLKRRGYDTLIAYNAAEARSALCDNKPDLFVLDIELPDGDGLSLCKEFRMMNDAPVLFLSGRKKLQDRVTGLGFGGDYYLTKPYMLEEFVAVVQSLLRRAEQTSKKIAEATIIKRGSLTLHLPQSKAIVNGHDAELTPKEFAVLLLLVQNEGKELTPEAIYEHVWKTDMYIDTGLIRKHISQIKKKLAKNDTNDFSILTEYGSGYIFSAD